jgi:hypothetical protein
MPEQMVALFKDIQRTLSKGDKRPKSEEARNAELEVEVPESEVAGKYRTH